ncbi:MAG TPA: c-type cytochrome biogenesis protein CcsB [Micromonosporaceae bacterium]
MAALSDQLLVVAILGYLVAMLCYAAEYSFGARGAVARVAARAAARPRELATVGAGGSTAAGSTVGGSTPPVVAPVSPAPVSPAPVSPAGGSPGNVGRRLHGLGVAALVFTVLAALAHAGCLATRGLAAHRVPWGNMYEFVLAVTLVAAVAWLVLVVRRPKVRPLGLFVALTLVVLLGLDGMVLYTRVAPLVPALNSYWLKIHVTLAATASGILLVGFCAAVLHQIRAGYERGKRGFPFTLGVRLPVADNLERLTFRVHAFAFPIWTLAIICGAIWAESAWGRYWGWDPKETWSFIAWVVYAGYLHARATPSVKRSTATWIAVVGWVAMMVNLFGVNFVVHGLHSYAGV